MQKFGLSLAVCLFPIFSGFVIAQEAPPAAPGPSIRVTTTEVALDLVVRDKHGRPVKNLKAGDVEVYEDGVRQQLLSFGMAGTRQVERREAGAGTTTQVSVKPVSRALREVNVLCIVFHNVDPVTRPHAMEAVQEFIKKQMPPETYIGAFNLNEQLIPVFSFTKDRDEWEKAARTSFGGRAIDFGRASEAILTANPTEATVTSTIAPGGKSASVNMQVTGGEISKSVITGADVSNSTGANVLRGDQVRERGDFSNLMGMHETDRIITMINELGKLPGHKTVLLVSTGLITTGDPDRFQAILDKANRAGITVYAVDTTPLADDSDTIQAGNNGVARVAGVSRTQSAVNSSLQSMREQSRQNDNMNDAVRASDTQSALRALSEGTGGFLIANTNNFSKPFQQIIQDLETHYEAVYHPASDKYDGHLRKIEVKVRGDLQVESREGYFAMPDLPGSGPLVSYEMAALGVLGAKQRPHAFDFHVSAFHFRNDGANAQSDLAFEIPAAALGSTPNLEHKTQQFHVSLLALVKDSGGQVVDKYSADKLYEIPDSNVQAMRSSAITYTHPLTLPPGHYTVETAMLDREAGRVSTTVSPIDNPARHSGVGISSIMLVQSVEAVTDKEDAADPLTFRGKRMVPMVATNLTADAKKVAYFLVYPDKANAEKPKIQVELLDGGQVVEQHTMDLPPAPDSSGVVPMFVKTPARPGSCELRITAQQGTDSATESVKYNVPEK